MNDLGLLLVLDLSGLHGLLSLLRLRMLADGDGGRPADEWLPIKNLVVCLTFILDKMGVSVGCANTRMTGEGLRHFDAFGAIDGSNEEMTKIVRSNFCFRINASLDNAALYKVPHVAGGSLDNLFACLFAVVNKDGRGFGDRANPEVFPHSFYGAVGDVNNSRFAPLTSDDNTPFNEIHVVDVQAARLGDAQARISQKQNIRSISELLRGISYSLHVINGFLDSVHVWVDKVAGALESVFFVCLVKEGRVNAFIGTGAEAIKATDRRSVHGLRGFGNVRSGKQEFYVSILREWSIVANDINKLMQGAFVGLVRLFFPRRIYEIQKGDYGIL